MTKLFPKSPITHTTVYRIIDMYRPRLLGPAEGQFMNEWLRYKLMSIFGIFHDAF